MINSIRNESQKVARICGGVETRCHRCGQIDRTAPPVESRSTYFLFHSQRKQVSTQETTFSNKLRNREAVHIFKGTVQKYGPRHT